MSQELDFRLFVASKNKKMRNSHILTNALTFTLRSFIIISCYELNFSRDYTDRGMRRRKNIPGKLDKRKPLGVIKLILRGCTA